MMDWRTLMQGPSTARIYPQNPQNSQKEGREGGFEDIEDIGEVLVGIKSDGSQKFSKSIFTSGQWVEFDSPLFGRCAGWIVEAEGTMYTLTHHSVLKERVKIPIAWVTPIVEEHNNS